MTTVDWVLHCSLLKPLTPANLAASLYVAAHFTFRLPWMCIPHVFAGAQIGFPPSPRATAAPHRGGALVEAIAAYSYRGSREVNLLSAISNAAAAARWRPQLLRRPA